MLDAGLFCMLEDIGGCQAWASPNISLDIRGLSQDAQLLDQRCKVKQAGAVKCVHINKY